MRSSLVVVLACLWAGSCSLTEFHHDDCHSATDCRAAFGFAAVCQPNGLCSPAGTTNMRCAHAYPPDLFTTPTVYKDWLVIGAMLNEDDPGDVAARQAITLAVQQVNDYGGLGVNVGAVGDGGARAGIKFAVAFCTAQDDHVAHAIDGLDDSQASAAVAKYLANDLGVPIILGPSTSIEAEAAYHALFPTMTSAPRPTGPVFISHSATSPALTGDDIWGLFWRTVPSDAEQGFVIAQDITTRHGATARVAEIVETGPYGDGLREAFGGQFHGTPTVLPFNAGVDAMRGAAVMQVGATHASYDEVLFISSAVADEPAFLTYAASLGTYGTLDIFLTDTAASSSAFLSASGSAATLFPRVRGTRFALASGPVYDQFVAAYSAAFMPPPAMDIHNFQYAPGAYDAAWLAFAGSSYAFHNTPDGVVTGHAVSEGLRHVSNAGATPLDLLPGNWAAIDRAFMARPPTDINVNGVSGKLDYDPVTQETSGPVEVWKIDTTTTPGMPRIVVDHTVTP